MRGLRILNLNKTPSNLSLTAHGTMQKQRRNDCKEDNCKVSSVGKEDTEEIRPSRYMHSPRLEPYENALHWSKSDGIQG